MTRRSWRGPRARALVPLLVVVVGAVASATSAAYLRRIQHRDTTQRFTHRAAEATGALTRSLDRGGDTLRGTRGLFDGSDDVSAAEFARYVESLDLGTHYPGLYAVAYLRADRSVSYVGPTGRDGGAVSPLSPSDAVREAQDRARDSGLPVSTPPVRLRSDLDGATAFVVYLPVYRGGGTPLTAEERRAAHAGWVVNAYRGADFVHGAVPSAAVELALFQGETLVGATAGFDRAVAEEGRTSETRATLYGSPWLVRAVAPPGFTPASYVVAPWLVLAGGLLVTALLALTTWVLQTGRRRAEAAVAVATRTLRGSEERFRALSDHSPTGVFFARPDATLEYWNPRLAEIAGTDAVDQQPLARLHPDDLPRVMTTWERCVAERSVFRGTYRLRRPDGTQRWIDVSSAPTIDGGEITGWVGAVNDVTDIVESTRHTSRLTRILEHTTDLVTLTDPDGEVVWANEAARAYMRAVGVVPHELTDLVAPGARTYFEDSVLPVLRRDGVWSGELSLLAPGGGELPVSQLVQAHVGEDGAVQYYSFSARDLSERRDYQDRLAHEVLHDRQTGLPNRALFVDRLTQGLARTARRDSLLAVLFVDLDRFKNVNDSLGHEAGDRLLVEVAGRLNGVLRSGDTASRFGGDAFTLLCEEVVDEAQAVAIARRVLTVLAVPFVLDDSPVHITASVGIALSDGSCARPEDLLRDADAALHRAKDLGKARYELFDERLRENAVARFQTESALHEALDLGQLRVHYQPEIDLRTGEIVAAEALVRWEHPVNGLVPPDAFIPLAEETGLIEHIGRWVLREACWQASRWRDVRADGEPFVVWVNLSPRQLKPEIVTLVRSALEEAGTDPAQLGVEVTETALLADGDGAIEVLRELRALGVRAVIDDFGTGYSSLAYLRRLPVDGVKIDRSFVANLGTSPEDAAIVAAVVGMASALGLSTVAEGVENDAQLAEVVRLGCDAAQGWYFARSQPRQAIDALLKQRPAWPGLVPSPRDVVTDLASRRRGRPAG